MRNVRHALSFFAAYSEVKWSKNTLDPEEKGLGQRDCRYGVCFSSFEFLPTIHASKIASTAESVSNIINIYIIYYT